MKDKTPEAHATFFLVGFKGERRLARSRVAAVIGNRCGFYEPTASWRSVLIRDLTFDISPTGESIKRASLPAKIQVKSFHLIALGAIPPFTRPKFKMAQ